MQSGSAGDVRGRLSRAEQVARLAGDRLRGALSGSPGALAAGPGCSLRPAFRFERPGVPTGALSSRPPYAFEQGRGVAARSQVQSPRPRGPNARGPARLSRARASPSFRTAPQPLHGARQLDRGLRPPGGGRLQRQARSQCKRRNPRKRNDFRQSLRFSDSLARPPESADEGVRGPLGAARGAPLRGMAGRLVAAAGRGGACAATHGGIRSPQDQ